MVGSAGFRIYAKVNRAHADLVALFEGLPVCNIDDSMHKIAAAHSGLKPLNQVPMLGTAITVKAPIGDNLMFHQAISMAQAGDVIVVDGGGCTERAICGENMMQIARQKGIKGFLIDGSVRDSGIISKFTDFSLFARGIMPNASFKGLGPGEINVPVSIGGMVVFPGDIIIGDCDGVVAVRPSDAQAVATAAHALLKKETDNLALILQGESDRSWVMRALENQRCTFLDALWNDEHRKDGST